jgi:hypothetical protein
MRCAGRCRCSEPCVEIPFQFNQKLRIQETTGDAATKNERQRTTVNNNVVRFVSSTWQAPNPSRKMLDHTIPAWAESDAQYYITICCCDRAKTRWPFPTSRKSSSMRSKLTNNANSGSSNSCYLCRIIFMGFSISHWKHPCKHYSQTGKGFFHANTAFAFSAIFSIIDCAQTKASAKKVEYIRYNPMRAGLVSESADWPYVYLHEGQLFFDQE